MKKILAFAFLAILMLSNKAYSQSNITWTLKDKTEKGLKLNESQLLEAKEKIGEIFR